jgi:hypothetical protein
MLECAVVIDVALEAARARCWSGERAAGISNLQTIRLNADAHTPTFWIDAGPSARCQGTEVSTPRG